MGMSDSGTDGELTERQQEIKERYLEERGNWSEYWTDLLKLDPEFLDRYRGFSAHPWKEGELDPKVKEFIYIAIDVSTTHLYGPGARTHIGNALDEGATVEEIMEVFQLVSVLGVHSVTDGVPILVEEAGRPEVDDDRRAEIDALRREFEENRGYWSEQWEDVATLDPEYFERYMEYSSHPWKTGSLDPKVKEFIYIAADISTTHLHARGARTHIQNALEYGATREEIMEVFELVSVLGVHTLTDNVPTLIEEAKKRGKLPEDF